MQRVLGIGGVFFRAREPAALARWYEENLGVDVTERVWEQAPGPTVFAPFPEDSGKFGRTDRQWMLNFRVADLDAMLDQLREAGADVEPEVQDEQGIGRFGWLRDPEGTRIELWEPDPGLDPGT